MPDYLNFTSKLTDLNEHEAQERLLEQLQRLQSAVAKLREADRVNPEIFDRVVSV